MVATLLLFVGTATSYAAENDHSAKIRDAVEKYFHKMDYKFSGFDEKNVARTSFKIDSKLSSANIILRVQKDRLQVISLIAIKADEENRPAVAEYLLRANYGMKTGGFDFDFNDGEISFRVSLYCGDDDFEPPTHEQIDHAIDICLGMVQRYGDGILKVVYGLQAPEAAIQEIEGE